MSTLLIRNGTVVTATDQYRADVFVRDDKIVAIGNELGVSADKEVDASDCYVLPGGIDAHTHMELPFMGTYASDTFYTGTLAGLHGGTTTIIDFAIQSQGDSLANAVKAWHDKADGHAVGDYAFHMAVTDFNDKTKAEVPSIINDEGINSFKTFMAYKGALMVDDGQMIQLMQELVKHGGILTTHAENGDMVEQLVKQFLAEGKTEPRYHVRRRPRVLRWRPRLRDGRDRGRRRGTPGPLRVRVPAQDRSQRPGDRPGPSNRFGAVHRAHDL